MILTRKIAKYAIIMIKIVLSIRINIAANMCRCCIAFLDNIYINKININSCTNQEIFVGDTIKKGWFNPSFGDKPASKINCSNRRNGTVGN